MQEFVKPTKSAAAPASISVASLKQSARRMARHCAAYRTPSTGRAVGQLASTVIPFLALAAAMLWLTQVNYWLVLILAVPLGGLIVRLFIIQHDCGHGSFLPSRKANTMVGRAMSLVTLVPYSLWRQVHALHHSGSGNLDRRGAGDIKTLTVREYQSLGWFGQLRYAIYRNPAFLFFVGIPVFFVVLQRQPFGHPLAPRECWRSVVGLDLVIVAVYGLLAYFVSVKAIVLVALPAIFVASVIGGWLFFIQHQFEGTHWDSTEAWDFQVAALQGSSFYDLPPLINWFTGNIGLHHIHHLNSMVPNYRLKECLAAMPELQDINRMTFLESLQCARLTLWDEETRRLVRFKDLPKTVANAF